MRFPLSQTSDRDRQRRLLGYGAVLVVVLIAFFLLPAARRSATPDPVMGETSPEPIPKRPRQSDPNPPLAADEFFAPPDLDNRDPSPRPVAARSDYASADPHLDPELLAGVKDNTLGVRAEEAEAFFAVLDQARHVPLTALAEIAPPKVLHADLMSEPALYRGEPITIVGDLWRLHEFPASSNPYDLTRLYEAWIFTSDSGPRPYRVVASAVDGDLKPGADRRTPVRVTGYFFKREGYESSDGVQVAPTLLAGRIERHGALTATAAERDQLPMMLGVVVALGLILAATLVSFAGNDRRATPLPRSVPLLSSDALCQADVDRRSVPEQLREFSERARSGQPLWGPLAAEPKSASTSRPKAEEYVELPTPFPPTRVSPTNPPL
jgi:hypothetical protein